MLRPISRASAPADLLLLLLRRRLVSSSFSPPRDEANDPSWIDRAIAKKVKGTHGAPLDDECFKRELIQRGVLAEENGKVTVKKSPFDVWGDGAEKWTVDA